MSTPRTDALLLKINEGRVYETEGSIAEHARQLETELAAAKERLAEIEADNARLREDAERWQYGVKHGFPYLAKPESVNVNPGWCYTIAGLAMAFSSPNSRYGMDLAGLYNHRRSSFDCSAICWHSG